MGIEAAMMVVAASAVRQRTSSAEESSRGPVSFVRPAGEGRAEVLTCRIITVAIDVREFEAFHDGSKSSTAGNGQQAVSCEVSIQMA